MITPKQALETLEGVEHHASLGEAGDVLLSVIRRDWVVRVLDAWASIQRPHAGWQWQVSDRGAPGEPERFECELRTVDLTRDDDGAVFPAATPDGARHDAAQAVFPELPDAVRAELGECP